MITIDVPREETFGSVGDDVQTCHGKQLQVTGFQELPGTLITDVLVNAEVFD